MRQLSLFRACLKFSHRPVDTGSKAAFIRCSDTHGNIWTRYRSAHVRCLEHHMKVFCIFNLGCNYFRNGKLHIRNVPFCKTICGKSLLLNERFYQSNISKYEVLLVILFSPRDRLREISSPLLAITKFSAIKTENKFSQNNETHNNTHNTYAFF